ncbi:TonB family protein [Novosphingobium resinovorum]|nr:TonB family protein [Novosphingobium resinovorum]
MLMGHGRGRLRRASPRVVAAAVTALVHLLLLAVLVQGQFRPAPTRTAHVAEQVIIMSHAPQPPVEPAPRPRKTARKPAETEAKMPPLPAIPLQAIVAPPAEVLAPGAEMPALPQSPAHRSPSDVIDDYRQALFDRLAARRHYPEAARLRDYQGDGAVLFRIDRGGNLLGAAMERSTGRALLDRAALTQVRRSAPFPEIPPELPDELAVSMPLQFLIVRPGRQMAAR